MEPKQGPKIHDNSVDSELILSADTNLEGKMVAGAERAKFNAGAMNRDEVEQHKSFAAMMEDHNAENEL